MRTVTAPPLHRSRDARLIAGVASGVAHHLGISPLVARTLFVLLCGLSSLGLLLYTALWAVLPQEAPAGAPGPHRRGGALTAYGMAGVGVLAVSMWVSSGRWSADISLWPAIAGVAGIGMTRHWAEAVRVSPGDTGARSDRRTFRLRLIGGGVLIAVGLIGGGPVVAIFLFGIGALTAAAVWRSIRRFDAEHETRLRERQRAVNFAVVHDQTLQILTLIQRDAGDAQSVHRLAGDQERTARGWR
jgi:phage shock protein PspC (stress-responsive transcriptional regulator)